jgi:hypothetical protein
MRKIIPFIQPNPDIGADNHTQFVAELATYQTKAVLNRANNQLGHIAQELINITPVTPDNLASSVAQLARLNSAMSAALLALAREV